MSVLERIYFFHGRIRSGRYPNTSHLISEFEISQATAHRDIAYLRERLLAPLKFDTRKNGFYYTRDDFRLPFENSPAMTMILGLLGNMAEETGLSELPELAGIKRHLREALFPGQRNMADLIYCEWVEKELVNSGIFATVLDALREQQQLQLTYRAGTGRTSRRKVEPLKLVNYQGRWYLLAWCLSKNDRRMFHLARMQKARLLQVPITEHHQDNIDDWLQASFGIFKGPATSRATIRFTGTAAEIVRHQIWHEKQKIEQEQDGIRLTLPIADDRELIMKVLQFGARAEILRPKKLRQRLAAEIGRMAEHYRD